jgi:guanylate kinase
MSKIFIVMGKSATGKDTIYKLLLESKELNLKRILMYTTRPIRKTETDGVEYRFVDEAAMREFSRQNKIIEHREYDTVQGLWHYFTVDDGKIDPKKDDYVIIGTLETFSKLRQYFGSDKVLPIYLEVENGTRLLRAIKREQKQEHPQYAEVCRRYLADENDFSDQNLEQNKIIKRYQNADVYVCLNQVIGDIKILLYTPDMM